MRKGDIICAGVILCLGILVMYDSIRLNIGWGMNGPEPGFYPFIMSLIVVIGSLMVINLAVGRKGVSQSDKPFFPEGSKKPVLNVIIPAVVMVILTEYVGLYLAAGLYLAFYMRWIGRHRWGTVILISVIVPLSTYVVFDMVFLVPTPKGSLEGIIGFE
jgi:hypothetical protein